MKNWIIIPLLFLAQIFLAQNNLAYSLIVVHYDPAATADFKQTVFSYHFLNGHFTGREELLSFKGRQNNKDYIRVDMGNNLLYKNRYLITGIGNIIDLKDKKVLLDQKLNLVTCRNDSAIYYTNDIFKGKFYSVYDFKTNQYAEVKALTFKALIGQDIEFDKSQHPFKLHLYPSAKSKILLTADAGYGQTINNDNKKTDPKVYWLNASNFIFTHFNKENTELTFIKINTESKSSAVIGKAAIKQQNIPGIFSPLDKTQIQYIFGDKIFVIDTEKNTLNELLFTSPENGFSVECKTNSYGHIIRLNDKEIGKQHFQLKNFKTEKEIAALVKELVVGKESYQQGLSVWNNSKKAWVSVDAEDVVALIGWIKD